MFIRSGLLALATLSLVACSDSGSDSPAPSADGPAATGDPAPQGPGADTGDVGSIGADAPSDAELQTAGGAVTAEQARALIPGRWINTDPGTQCVSTLSFSNDGTFTLNELDKVAGGFYGFDDFDGGLEITYDYTSDNGRVDCFGDNETLVEEGVTFSDFVSFPDRSTLRFSSRANGEGFPRDYARQ